MKCIGHVLVTLPECPKFRSFLYIIFFGGVNFVIDTVKIIAPISKEIYYKILSFSDVKKSFSVQTGELYYEIVSSSLEGSYSSSLSVRVMSGSVFGLFNDVVIIEGSYHKIMRGQNAYDGFTSVPEVCRGLIKLVEIAYNIKLPSLRHWFLQRVDITNCFDLFDNSIVCRYINNLAKCRYPRRKLRFYDDESIYVSGKSTTLKIYNKLLEFRKNDMNKVRKTEFDVITFMNHIKGFIRFEVEVKKRKLVDLYDTKFIRVDRIKYDDLLKVWSDEFMKLLKLCDGDLKPITNKDKIEIRLFRMFGKIRGRNLYNFYLAILLDGFKNVKGRMCDSVYYRNLSDLKKAKIDLSQTQRVVFEDTDFVDFNPFNYEMVV